MENFLSLLAGLGFWSWLAVALILMALETVTCTPRHLNPTGRTHPSGCLVCAPGRPCEHPVTAQNITRPEWVADRMNLLRELRATPDMTEDEREHHMTVLINHQRGAQPT
jgi:hypothetical protein